MNVDIIHLAKLSRLNIENEKQFEAQMSSIIEMVENLPKLNSEQSLVDANNPMVCREDVVQNNFTRDDILRNAPQTKAGCVVVPRVIE